VALEGTLGVAIEVFAEEGGAVAGVVEPGGHGRVLVAEPVEGREAAILANIVEDPVRVGVLPAQDRGARGAAQRRRDEGVGKRQPLRGEERLHVGHAGNRPGIEIVGDDDDDIWRPCGCGISRVIIFGREGLRRPGNWCACGRATLGAGLRRAREFTGSR
jgi:hypothetical protein